MCGIVGIITNQRNGFNYKELEAFETMLFLDTLRGWDSTGVFGVTNDKDVFIAKEASHAPDYLQQKEWKDLRSKMFSRGKYIVGHNRAATRGTVNDKNAHPFCVDDKIVLVQNGTYKGSHKHHKDVEVDTEAVAHVLSETTDVEEALNKINAAYALVWYNTENSKLHVIRNDERPLFMAISADDSIFFASESNTILYAGARHDIKWKEKPYMCEPHVLVTFELMKNKDFETEEKKLTIKPKEVAPVHQNFPVVQHLGNSRHMQWPGYDSCGDGTEDDACAAPFAHSVQRRGNAIMAVTREVVSQGTTHTDLTPNESSYSVTKTFSEIIIEGHKEHHMDLDVGESVLRGVDQKAKSINIELEDYAPANDHRDCEMWHVWGRDLDPHNQHVLYHWLVREQLESKILNMVGGSFYKVKPTTPHMRIFTKQNFKRSIVTCYGTEAELVYTKDKEETKHVH